ncbi:MAG: hypothetical protein IJU33_11275 [Bacteroidales bacterium]|nr:hypothetical protein [Bacteroidales bacterium]
MVAWADDGGAGGKNYQVSFTPFGFVERMKYGSLDSKGDKQSRKIFYKSVIGGSLAKEFNLGKSATLLELSYMHAKADKYEYLGKEYSTDGRFNDLTSVSIMYYLGKTIFPAKRFQVPIYIGVGGEVVQGYPFHHLMFDLGAKARMKFYITRKFGVFAGVTGKWGYGHSTYGEGSSAETASHHHLSANFDAGLTFEL